MENLFSSHSQLRIFMEFLLFLLFPFYFFHKTKKKIYIQHLYLMNKKKEKKKIVKLKIADFSDTKKNYINYELKIILLHKTKKREK